MITVIGAGRVGTSAAAFIMIKELDRKLCLIDIIEGVPQGEALDLNHSASILGKSVEVVGSNDYSQMAGSDIVIVTADRARKSAKTREELASENAAIVSEIASEIKKYAPDSIVIITTNPVDSMAVVLYRKLGFPRNRVIGFSGILDSKRMAYFVSLYIGVSPSSITPIVLGQHGEAMYPVPELSMVYGKSLKSFLAEDLHDSMVRETVEVGNQIINLRKFSSNWGPAAGLMQMVQAIKKDSKAVLEASVYLDGEYGFRDVFAEVPVVLGKEGVEKIIEVDLSDEQRERMKASIDAIKNNLARVPDIYLK
jgi:malate dehydrogenase